MSRTGIKLEIPGGERKVLLHTCCAPCSSAIIEYLITNDIEPIVFYSNSNIFPDGEYEIRKNECFRYCAAKGVTVEEDEYNHDDWKRITVGLEEEKERGRRCLACFRYRLLRSAKFAESRGIGVLTTALASSRWKSLDQVNEAGRWACAQVKNVTWWEMNWRKGGLQERRNEILKEMDFYNQLYCGCEYSL